MDKLHAQGILGAGVKIGMCVCPSNFNDFGSHVLVVLSIDTGIDYTHPVLGGGIGPGHKVIGGFDFVGDAYTGEFYLSILFLSRFEFRWNRWEHASP